MVHFPAERKNCLQSIYSTHSGGEVRVGAVTLEPESQEISLD